MESLFSTEIIRRAAIPKKPDNNLDRSLNDI